VSKPFWCFRTDLEFQCLFPFPELHARQRGDVTAASSPPFRGMALLFFGGNRIALKISANTVMHSTTRILMTALLRTERI
jgi:hypothetical protein